MNADDAFRATGFFLYKDLAEKLKQDADVDELDFLVVEPPPGLEAVLRRATVPAANTSAAQAAFAAFAEGKWMVMEEHKLGIPFWTIPPLFNFAQGLFFRVSERAAEPSAAGAVEADRMVDAYMEVVSRKVGALPDEKRGVVYRQELEQVTRVLTLLNGEYYAGWNARKRMLTDAGDGGAAARAAGALDELKFVELVFSKHPKSGEAWSHRRWVLTHLRGLCAGAGAEECAQAGADLDDTLVREFPVCQRAAEKYRKNYYAWTHRQWVLDQLSPARRRAAALAELDATQSWGSLHVSDYCGFHYRQVLLRLLNTVHDGGGGGGGDDDDDDDDDVVSTTTPGWADELRTTEEAMLRFPGHESLWQHRRFLFLHQCTLDDPNGGPDALAARFRAEQQFLRACLKRIDDDGGGGGGDVVASDLDEALAAAQVRFATLYGSWLRLRAAELSVDLEG